MSYNYLPLDRKWLHFQQVKNLLDYDQLVSITFDAHERILKCREYLDNISASKKDPIQQNGQSQDNLLQIGAVAIGEEVPADIVKLMLMLKIKSLGHGHSGVQIETVKRLMEMYNNGVLPVVYTQGISGAGGDVGALSQLSLPLIGLAEVYFKGQKRESTSVLTELKWQPVSLVSYEAPALTTGTQFSSACGLFALKKTEQLLKFADVIAALSFDVFGCSVGSLDQKLTSIRSHKGEVNTASIILKYLDGSDAGPDKKASLENPYSFACTPAVHGSAKDAFDYVLNVFLKEINSVTESPVFFADEDLILTSGNFNTQPLELALNFLANAMCGVGSISERRSSQLINGKTNLSHFSGAFQRLHSVAAAIPSENKSLSIPASVDNISLSNNLQDFESMGATAAIKCLQVINNIERILAIELMAAAQAWESRKASQSPPFLEQLVTDFREQVSSVNEDAVLNDHLTKATEFVQRYKF